VTVVAAHQGGVTEGSELAAVGPFRVQHGQRGDEPRINATAPTTAATASAAAKVSAPAGEARSGHHGAQHA